MAEKQSPGIAYVVSLCGIMCGLSLALMFCLGMIPGFEYVSPAWSFTACASTEYAAERRISSPKQRSA